MSNLETVRFTVYLTIFISDCIGYIYLLLKIFRIFCFTKITLDQLPFFNPYKWPISLIRIITKPYFKFWSKLLPNLKLGKVSYDVSSILGLEVLSGLIYLSLQFRTVGLIEAQHMILESNL